MAECPRCGLNNMVKAGSSGSCGACSESLQEAPADQPTAGVVRTEREALPARPPVSVASVDLKRFSTVATVLRWLLAGQLVVILMMIMVAYGMFDLVGKVQANEPISYADVVATERQATTLSQLYLFIFAVGAVLFVWWFYRAYQNLRSLRTTGHRFSTGWAVGAWFVPILNLFRPFQIAEEIWRGSDPDAPVDASVREGNASEVVRVWWFLMLGAGFFLNSLTLSDDLAAFKSSILRYMIGLVLTLVSCYYCLRMVRTVTFAQGARRAKLIQSVDEPSTAHI